MKDEDGASTGLMGALKDSEMFVALRRCKMVLPDGKLDTGRNISPKHVYIAVRLLCKTQAHTINFTKFICSYSSSMNLNKFSIA